MTTDRPSWKGMNKQALRHYVETMESNFRSAMDAAAAQKARADKAEAALLHTMCGKALAAERAQRIHAENQALAEKARADRAAVDAAFHIDAGQDLFADLVDSQARLKATSDAANAQSVTLWRVLTVVEEWADEQEADARRTTERMGCEWSGFVDSHPIERLRTILAEYRAARGEGS